VAVLERARSGVSTRARSYSKRLDVQHRSICRSRHKSNGLSRYSCDGFSQPRAQNGFVSDAYRACAPARKACTSSIINVSLSPGRASMFAQPMQKALSVNKMPCPIPEVRPISGTSEPSCSKTVRAWMATLTIVLSLALCAPAAISQQVPATPRSNSEVESAERSRPLTIPVPKPRTATTDPQQEASSSLQVTANGKLLTIQAKDCTLSEILDAVRAKTGASIDVSGGTSEHMTVKIGPGPARQVLASLLAWTDFDYVIQGADADSVAIQSVMLIPKSKSSPTAAAAGTPAPGPNRQPLAGQPRMAVEPTPTPTPVPVETPEPEAAAPAQQPTADSAPVAPVVERPAGAASAITPDTAPATSTQGKSATEMIQQQHNQTPGAPPPPSH
jgi:hypothetical protein